MSAPVNLVRRLAHEALGIPVGVEQLIDESDQIIYRRAHDRGEIDLDRIPPAVLAMPFDLVRHDLLMNLKSLRPARIDSIVDELFLPLLQSHQSGRASTRLAITRPASRSTQPP